MDSGLPPYLAQQYGMGNSFMGGPFESGFMNAPAAYMTGASIYGPTYGQFSPDAQALMPTPYGGGMNLPYVAAYRSSMTNHPFKAFMTYSLPILTSPKGLSPVFYNNYLNESKVEALQSAESMGTATALGLAGNAVGGPIGAIAGSLIGLSLSKMTGEASGRQIQIHEIGNLLHINQGSNKYGVGITTGQAADLYKMFAKSGAKDINMSEEEYQLAFSSLAKNGMIDDTGGFGQAKESIKKMKHIIVGLQDLFQNGDIKTIVASLRQLRNVGVFTGDLSSTSISSSVAASMLGQKPSEYITNTIGTAQNESGITGFSTAWMYNLNKDIDISTNTIKDVASDYMKGLGVNDLGAKFKQTLVNSMQETASTGAQDILLSNKIFSPQLYTITAMEAGIQAYNKKHGDNYTMQDVISNPNLMHTIETKYAMKAMNEVQKKYKNNAAEIVRHYMGVDTSYGNTIFNPEAEASALKHVTHPEKEIGAWMKLFATQKKDFDRVAKEFPGQFSALYKISEISRQNPDLLNNMHKEEVKKTKEASADEKAHQIMRNDSVESFIDKIIRNIQYRMAGLVNEMTPHSGLREVKSVSNSKFMNGVKVLEMTKDFKPDKKLTNALETSSATFHDGFWLDGIFGKAEGGSISQVQKLFSHVMSRSSLDFDEKTIVADYKYRRVAALAEKQYMAGVDNFFRNPNKKYSLFTHNMEDYYASLKTFKPGDTREYVFGGQDISVKDKEGLQVFKELVNSTKHLSNRIRELTNKKNLTSEEKKELVKDKHQFSINKNSFKSLYTGTVMGGADLFKESGQDITADKLQGFAHFLHQAKKWDPSLYKKYVSEYAATNHITESVAKHNFDLLASAHKDKRYFETVALKASSLFKSNYAGKLFVKGGAADFMYSAGGTKLLSTATKFKDMNKFLESLDKINKAYKSLIVGNNGKFVDNPTESTKKILATIGLGSMKISNKQAKAVSSLYFDLKENWDSYTGGHSFTIDGKKISDFKDFASSSTKVKKDFISQVASSSILLNASEKLGLDSQELGSTRGQAMLKELFKTGKTGGIVEFKNGRFQLTKDAFKNLSSKKEKEALEYFGVGANKYGLKQLVNELNQKDSGALTKTNSILGKIYNTLEHIKTNLAKHKTPIVTG